MKRKTADSPPPIPAEVFSLLGPLPVTFGSLAEGVRGEVELHERHVTILPELPPAIAWQTFWHESTHVALHDAGVANVLDAKLEENICDAIGTYLAAMVRQGKLKVLP